MNPDQTTLSPKRSIVIVGGVLIFFAPLVKFFSPVNFGQLDRVLVYELILSLAIILIGIVLCTISVSKISKFFFGRNPRGLFAILCFFFYLQFFYKPFSIFLHGYFPEIADVYVSLLKFGFFELLCTTLALLAFRWRNIAIPSIVLFSLSVITLSVAELFFHMGPEVVKIAGKSHQKETVSLASIPNEKERRNVYFIMLDGMMALETASRFTEVDPHTVNAILDQSGLTYIPKSISSYNTTHLSIASLMIVDFPVEPNSERYGNRHRFYPMLMQGKGDVPLVRLIKNAGGRFIWAGNNWGPCHLSTRWTCFGKASIRSRPFLVFYETTPFIRIVDYLIEDPPRESSRYPLFNFLNDFKPESETTPFFAFIHHMAPHPGWVHNANCDFKNYGSDKKRGYSNSYRCVLKTISRFLKWTENHDPEAVVIIQGDHGWARFGVELSAADKINLRARIFNAIRAPKKCFDRFGTPSTTINAARFALNCGFGFALPYREKKHFLGFYESDPSGRFGEIVDAEVNFD